MKEVEVGKMWSDYSKKEKEFLPPIPKEYLNKKNPPFMWNGFFWEYVLID